MKADLHLEKIVEHLKNKYKCNSIIVYGSRARGDTTKYSDYDVVGIGSKQKKLIRIAKEINGVYWDVWVYPENKLKKIDISMINMHQGKVIYDTKAFGKKLLKRIAQFYKKGPEKLLRWEKELKISWLNKSFARATHKDEEGNVRRY
jgi:predicted nucleotidyltransferase